MSILAQAIRNTPDARTDNGAETFSTTKNPLVDLFFLIGGASLKTVPIASLIAMFEDAYAYDSERAVRLLLWLRDIRGGAGRREIFRQIMLKLEKRDSAMAKFIIPHVAEYGRWDDILIFEDAQTKEVAYSAFAKALVNPKTSGLAAKWAPRKGKVAAELRNFLKLTPKQYRKLVVNLSNTVETLMCAKQWENVEYSHVPSLASIRYAKAFGRHDEARYQAWKAALVKGDPKVKVNVGAVYPHDVIYSLRNGDAKLADEMWKRLPNYIGDASIMPMVDTSASMTWTKIQGNIEPMHVAVSLGLYLAEKNSGPFQNLMMTFTSTPTFVELTGATLQARMNCVNRASVGGSTDIQAAFRALLNKAIASRAKQSDMPEMILILSDMQFNGCVTGTNFQGFEKLYRDAGYKMPKVVFWNLNGGMSNNPVRFDQSGVALVSGFSPALMTSVLSADQFSPQSIVDAIIMTERYNIFA